MRGGVLQEVGDPGYLYDHPANIFVAGFIGSPPMNMAVGTVVREGPDLAVRLGPTTLRLHPAVTARHPALAAYVAREVAVGVRGEDMADARLVHHAPGGACLKAEVSRVEALAVETLVHFELDAPRVVADDDASTPTGTRGARFVASFAPRSRVRAGDRIDVVVDTGRMHFFDPETGSAIRD
jgi:multiple sugar transport system ATP-binding protein